MTDGPRVVECPGCGTDRWEGIGPCSTCGHVPEPPCPFCEIVAGRSLPPGGIVYSDDLTLAFEPLRPFVPGHLLVIPRQHVESVAVADRYVLFGVMSAVQELCNSALGRRDTTGADGVNVLTSVGEAATQTVFHWHVHVVPRREGDPLGRWPWERQSRGRASLEVTAS